MPSVYNYEIEPLPETVEKDQDNELLDRTTFLSEFETDAYLKDFYTKVDEPAMQMVLNFLPNIVARIGPISRLLDFGAGPTIHVAASFRNQADEIFLADYLPQNRAELELWRAEKSSFDWTIPLRMILTQEGQNWNTLNEMQPQTRQKVKSVFHCDCFSNPAVDAPKAIQGTFDAIVTIFCIEYCCNTYEEYKQAVKNIAAQIKPGGFFVMGGILEETWCSFGGKKFSCLYITKEMMLDALEEAGITLNEDRKCIMYEINGMFMICAQKC